MVWQRDRHSTLFMSYLLLPGADLRFYTPVKTDLLRGPDIIIGLSDESLSSRAYQRNPSTRRGLNMAVRRSEWSWRQTYVFYYRVVDTRIPKIVIDWGSKAASMTAPYQCVPRYGTDAITSDPR